MKLPHWCYSIRVKVAVAVSILIATISSFVFWYFPAKLEEQAMEALIEKANAVATMTAYNLTPALLSDNRPAVCDVVISAKQNPDLDYVMVLDDSNRVIATFDSSRALALHYDDVAFQEKVSEDGLTYETTAPIFARSRLLGRVYLGLSLHELHNTIAHARRTIAFVSIAISAAGILIVIVLTTIITTPLAKVVKTAERISSGDWTQRTNITSKDEVGQLGGAFDTMIDNLELVYQDLRRSEKNYRDLFASNPHPMWVNDVASGAILDVNDAAIESYGYSRDEFLSVRIQDIIVESPGQEMETLRGRSGDLFRSVGWKHIRKDGSFVDIEMSSHILPLRSGRKERLVLSNDITNRLRADALLRESEERYRDLFENSSDLIQSVSADGKIQFVNRAWMETLGYKRNEVESLNIFDILKKDVLEHCQNIFHEVMAGKRIASVQTIFIAKDGREVVVEGSVNAKFEKGKAVSTRGIFRDITERKRADESIFFEKSRFEQLFENAPIGIVLCDRVEKIVHANEVFRTMFGYSLPELTGRTLNEIVLPEDLVEEGSSYTQRVLSGEPIHGETTRHQKDGRLIDVDVYGVPIVINGESIGLFGIYVDISERKKAEREIRLLAHAVASTKDCVTITDLADRLIFVNDAFVKNFGYAREEVIGQDVAILRPTKSRNVIGNDILPATLAGGYYGEISNQRKDGTEFPIELWTSVVTNHEGEPVAMVGVARDITERKLIENTQAELMKDLEDINKELNDFAYIVSHDLKAPLRAIGSLANWLMNDYGNALGQEGGEMLKMLLGRTKRMHDLIDGILKYSRIGRNRGECESIELGKLVPEIVDLIGPPGNVDVAITSPLPTIVAERTRVQQVFQNLLSNSIKFMDKPKGNIQIGCERENGHWKFSVTDNGPGIDEKHFAKIFQIFQTLAARDEFESTGIGLTIVKKIVEVYGGRIWVESRVGEGTTFHFTLPASAN